MLFTDVSAERALNAFRKTGFWIAKRGGIIRDAGLTDEEFKKLL